MDKAIITSGASGGGSKHILTIKGITGTTISISKNGGVATIIPEEIANPGYWIYSGAKMNDTYTITMSVNSSVLSTQNILIAQDQDYGITMPATLTYDFFQSYGTFVNSSGSHNIILNCYNGYDGIAFIGRDTSNSYPTRIRWDWIIDTSIYKKVDYKYCRYAIHGNHGVLLSDGMVSNAQIYASNIGNYGSYTEGSSSWYGFSLNFPSTVSGLKTLTFYGGYTDSSGNTSSQTRYSQIILS